LLKISSNQVWFSLAFQWNSFSEHFQ
jgi:hypothetical protein